MAQLLNFFIPKRKFFTKIKEMKKLVCTSIFAVLVAVATVNAQNNPKEYLGLPGDNLNLYAVMNLFQESETLEAFETSLNDENSRINNLDLNGDNMVDYITVTDYVNNDVHTIVLRTALSRNEQQDIAVFTVEKIRNGAVQIQLIGDEALYGRNYIVEPIYAETPNPGYKGRTVYRDNVTVVTTTYYEVAAWPVIRFIYNPYYVSWRSSWYWDYYPVYWNPWRPYYWHYYYGYHSHWYPHYYSHYRHWHQPRYYGYHDYYYRNVRAYSPYVSKRITEGHYKQTYSRPETRRDGEALYSSTRDTRNSSARPAAASGDRRSEAATGSSSRPAAATGTDRRSSAATGSSGRPAEASGTDRRTPAAAGSRSEGSRSEGTSYSGQNSEVRRSTSDAVKSAPASTARSSSSTEASRQTTAQRSQAPQSSAQRSQSTVQRSSQAPAQRSEAPAQRAQSTVQRSQPSATRSQASQPSAQRSQATVQRSQAPAQRSEPSAARSQAPAQRSQATVQKSSPSVSQRSSAPAARSQSSSRSSEGRSSSAPSSSSRSSSNSKSSDNNSRSSRR